MEQNITLQIIEQANKCGADMAGIADAGAVKQSPSHTLYRKLDPYIGGDIEILGKEAVDEESFPNGTHSAIVIAVEHPRSHPEMDWWQAKFKGGTPGNRSLIQISARVARWLRQEKSIAVHPLPYLTEMGGVFLKDAAVMAGLGCIGKNNLLVTPNFGPRVRLRAMLIDAALPPTGPVDFDPCQACGMACRSNCPQQAFQDRVFREGAFGLHRLPGRTGEYDRTRCHNRMELDIQRSEDMQIGTGGSATQPVKYCRRCELHCSVGR